MFHKISGAAFFVDIVMSDYIVGGQLQLFAQPCSQLYQGIIGGFVVFAAFVRMAGLHGNGVKIAGRIGIGDLADRNALENLSLQPYDEVAAGGAA